MRFSCSLCIAIAYKRVILHVCGEFDIFLFGINYTIRCRRMGNLLRLLHAKSDEKEDKDIFIDFESMLTLV